jgi:hypothetical protein
MVVRLRRKQLGKIWRGIPEGVEKQNKTVYRCDTKVDAGTSRESRAIAEEIKKLSEELEKAAGMGS